MDNQSLGVAQALGLKVTQKRLQPAAPWKHLPPQLWLAPLRFLGRGSDAIAPPWPDIVIGTGRLTVAVALAIKRASGGRTFNIRIQDPHTAYDEFDVIVTPQHDRCRRPNVVATLGGLHTITRARIQEAAERVAEQFAKLPRPRVAVLVGGNNKRYRLTPEIGRALGAQLAALSADTGASILLTPSRRTGPEVESALRDALTHTPAHIWDGTGENPYLAYLGLADYFVVTADSVNMVSEACTTGKPVFIAELEGGSRKFELFHEALQTAGYTRPFSGRLETWTYPPLDDVGRAAEAIRERLALR